MAKITIAQALQLAEENFPQGPEKLAEHLEVVVESSPIGCDGWCIQTDGCTIIRLNSEAFPVRRRFTLAHEIGHLILGIPSIVGESTSLSAISETEEERQVNAIAGDILLPIAVAKNLISEIPVTSESLRRIAKKANVSELFVARRLAFLASEIGLKYGSVVHYKNSHYAWHWPNKPTMPPDLTNALLKDCQSASPNPFRTPLTKKNVMVASIVENPYLDTTTIFVQVVAEEHGLKKSEDELMRELLSFVLGDKSHRRSSLEGCFSFMKSRVKDLSVEEAVSLFNTRYLDRTDRWDEEFRQRLKSVKGQEYIRIRLKPWVKK